jgi:hypothetical protein
VSLISSMPDACLNHFIFSNFNTLHCSKCFLSLFTIKNITEKDASILTIAHLYMGPTQFVNLPVLSCSAAQQVPGQYRKLTEVNPSSSFPMHYSLNTLLWKAIESALLSAVFINRMHMCTNVGQELFPCDPIIGNVMGRACGTYGEEKHLQDFGGEAGRNEPILMS